jgi:dsRNA-specific ribonuclease
LVITTKAIDKKQCQEKIALLLDSLQVSAQDIRTFVLAFIHRSIVNERADFAPEHNERLEFL